MSDSNRTSVALMSMLDDMSGRLTSHEYHSLAQSLKTMHELEDAVRTATACLIMMLELAKEKDTLIERLQKRGTAPICGSEDSSKRRRRYPS